MDDVDIFPDFDAVGGRDAFVQALGALLTIVLIFAVLMLLISAIAWALAASHGNDHVASRARTGVLVCIGAAAMAGAGVGLMNFLLAAGAGI